jgi:predicted RNase H-like HicB family nuclease
MLYPVLVEQRPNGQFQASVPAIPNLVKFGLTRNEALQKIQRALIERLHHVEVVYLDIPLPNLEFATAEHWLATAGMFADDPTLEPMLKEIYAARDAE